MKRNDPNYEPRLSVPPRKCTYELCGEEIDENYEFSQSDDGDFCKEECFIADCKANLGYKEVAIDDY
jgi:hypothetical protein